MKENEKIEEESNEIYEIIKQGATGEPIPFQNYNIFLEQNEYSIFKIIKDNKNFGTGFLCIIPYPDKLNQLPVLITCNHILAEEDIKIGKEINLNFRDIHTKKLYIDESRKVYTNNKYDITIIEIKKDDGFKINKILEIDNNIYDLDNKENLNIYKKCSIYIIHYPNGKNSLSTGIIKEINNDNVEINHSCPTRNGSSGAPIINISTFKVVAIHIGGHLKFNYNLGTVLREPLKEFYENTKNFKSNKSRESKEIIVATDTNKILIRSLNDVKNEINFKINILKKDIEKKIYYVDNTNFSDWETRRSHKHDFLKELNESNTRVFINNKEIKYNKYFIPKKKGIYEIKIVFNLKMKDCSYMFSDCGNILSIDFSHFDSSCVTRLNHMFYECYLLESINFDNFYTGKVVDLSYMFLKCTKLKELDISSFDISKVEKMSDIFLDCKELKNVKLNKGSFNKIKEKLPKKTTLIEKNN